MRTVITALTSPQAKTLEEDLTEFCQNLVNQQVQLSSVCSLSVREREDIEADITRIFRRHGEEPAPFEARLDQETGILVIGDPLPPDQIFCAPNGDLVKSWGKR